MRPLFSVIVPIYKVEKYLVQCIESIVAQPFDDYELILVDDGSPDCCPTICDEYAKKHERIKVIHKNNGGLVSARKAGCAVSEGKYILNVDGDDWISEGYFEEISQIAREYSPDVICFGSIKTWSNKQETCPYPYEYKYYNREEIENDIFPVLFESLDGRTYPPSIWSKAFRRDLYIQYQLQVDDRISIGEDIVCTKMVIYNAESMFIMPDCLYYYRQNEQSMTKNKKAFPFTGPQLIFESFQSIAKSDKAMSEQISRCVYHRFFMTVISQFNRKESYFKICEEIKEELNKPYMQYVMKNCHYSYKYIIGWGSLYVLKWRLFYLIKLANGIKNN